MARLHSSKVRGVTQPSRAVWLVRWTDARGVDCRARYVVGRDAADDPGAKVLAEQRKLTEEALRDEGRTVRSTTRRGVVTVRDVAERWLARPAKRPTTEARDRSCIEAWLLGAYGHWAAGDVTPQDCRDLVERWRDAGKSDRTVVTYAGVVRAMWRWAEAAELVDRSPWRAVDLPTRTRDARPRVHATLGDLDRLGDALGEDYRPVVWLGMLGLRAQEMFGLRRGDLVLMEGRATLTVARTVNDVRGRLVTGDGKSTASARTIALPESVRADLSTWLVEHGRLDDLEAHVLQAPRGGPVRYPAWRSRVWAPATVAAGLEGLRVHALRHLAIAAMREAGVPLDVASQRVGHSDIRTTLVHYGRLPDAVNRDAADRLDALIGAQSGTRIGAISANGGPAAT